jgi:hypothetical protein
MVKMVEETKIDAARIILRYERDTIFLNKDILTMSWW